LEKIRKISGRNTASTKSPELPGTGRFQAGLFDLVLFALLPCTPQLHRLKFLNLIDRNVDINVIEPLILLNMTDLSIQIYRMSFDEFEKLMSK